MGNGSGRIGLVVVLCLICLVLGYTLAVSGCGASGGYLVKPGAVHRLLNGEKP